MGCVELRFTMITTKDGDDDAEIRNSLHSVQSDWALHHVVYQLKWNEHGRQATKWINYGYHSSFTSHSFHNPCT